MSPRAREQRRSYPGRRIQATAPGPGGWAGPTWCTIRWMRSMGCPKLGARRASAAVLLAVCLSAGCAVARSGLGTARCNTSADCAGEACIDGECRAEPDAASMDARVEGGSSDAGTDARPDSGGEADGGVDGGPDAGVDGGIDGGFPGHCRDGMLSSGETDVDCGGECSPCRACRACSTDLDCASHACTTGVCRAVLSSVPTRTGVIPAYVRDDGAILLAYYAPGTYPASYDPSQAQESAVGGGGGAPTGWAPDPCFASGHLSFSNFDPMGKTVVMQCGHSFDDIMHESSSRTLFTSFDYGDKGTVDTVGAPGWGIIAALSSGLGRGNFGICGGALSPNSGGIAYCDGAPRGSFANHLVSFAVTTSAAPYVGCGGTGCVGSSCDLGVWVWLAE